MSNWRTALRLEHKVAQIITQQEINGVAFDYPRAMEYLSYLEDQQEGIRKAVEPLLKPEVYQDRATVRSPFTKAGSLSKRALDIIGEAELIGGPFTPVTIERPDISKRQKMTKALLEEGWEPELFTPTGQPKLTDKGKPVDSLLKMQGGIGESLARWYILNHRRGVIQGWVNNIRPDGRLTAGANPCGTPTGRMTHRTVVNVPKANRYRKGHEREGELIWDIEDQSEIFGTQMRSLFIAPKGKVLVGHDASGLESRMLANRLGDPELTYEIIEGDFHSKIWEPIQEFVHSRDNAKNVEYALIYGALNPKLGSMVDYKPEGWSDEKMGGVIRELIMESMPALDDLTRRVQRQARKGHLIGLDGRKLFVRSLHSALNLQLQSDGAIIMKASMCYLHDWVKKKGLDVLKVIDMHDEAQAEVDPEHAELYADLAVKSIIKAGELFNLSVPLDGEAKIGRHWAETH